MDEDPNRRRVLLALGETKRDAPEVLNTEGLVVAIDVIATSGQYNRGLAVSKGGRRRA